MKNLENLENRLEKLQDDIKNKNCDKKAILEELNNIKESLNSDDKNNSEPKVKTDSILIHFTENQIYNLFDDIKSFIKSKLEFCNSRVDNKPPFQDAQFDIDYGYEVKLTSIEVDTSEYINRVEAELSVHRAGKSNYLYEEFVNWLEKRKIKSDTYTDIMNSPLFKGATIILFNKTIQDFIIDELSRFNGYYKYDVPADDYYEVEINYNKELSVKSLIVYDFYGYVLNEELDLDDFRDALATDYVDKLEELLEKQEDSE